MNPREQGESNPEAERRDRAKYQVRVAFEAVGRYSEAVRAEIMQNSALLGLVRRTFPEATDPERVLDEISREVQAELLAEDEEKRRQAKEERPWMTPPEDKAA